MLRRSLRNNTRPFAVCYMGEPILNADCLLVIIEHVLSEQHSMWKHWHRLHAICGKEIASQIIPFFLPHRMPVMTREMIVSCLLCDRIDSQRAQLERARTCVQSRNFTWKDLRHSDFCLHELGVTIQVMHKFLDTLKRRSTRLAKLKFQLRTVPPSWPRYLR